MPRPLTPAILVLAGALSAGPGRAATLERLSMDEMIHQSTEIVRGRVMTLGVSTKGSVLYTLARVEVLERWKGPTGRTVEIWIPGGRSGNLRQTFSGAPSLSVGGEYVLFLWAGSSGNRQVIGFSQGAFDVKLDAKGSPQMQRAATSEAMLDDRGQQVEDVPVRMSLAELRKKLRSVLGLTGGAE
ncbi:MAG: hypothetical protein IT163_14700 [Bryobacterales bacterium]|nr:hypothetical protein [Bryobacterales bacterium]